MIYMNYNMKEGKLIRIIRLGLCSALESELKNEFN